MKFVLMFYFLTHILSNAYTGIIHRIMRNSLMGQLTATDPRTAKQTEKEPVDNARLYCLLKGRKCFI